MDKTTRPTFVFRRSWFERIGFKSLFQRKRSSENLISKFSDDLQSKQCLLVGFITFDGKEDDVEIAHG